MTIEIRRHLTSKHSTNLEPIIPRYVVLHDTEGTYPGVLTWLADTPAPPASVSVHYLITETGVVYQIGLDTWCMWHAGRTYWADRSPGVGVKDSGNRDMIGIEIEHVTAKRGKTYPAVQLSALDALIDHLFSHHTTLKGVVGHKDIASPRGRKSDPQLSVADYTIEAVRKRLKPKPVPPKEDEMTEEQDRLLRELKVSSVAQSFLPGYLAALMDGDGGNVAAVLEARDVAVAAKRKELGLDK